MYIAQAYKFLHDWWRYAIPVLGFFGLMALNYFVVVLLDIDVDALMKSEIESKGSNRFFLENLIPFTIFLIGLFVWVKYVHKQTIKSLTTTRTKIDWGRIWFAFVLIAIIIITQTCLDYYLNPENFELQFELQPFLILSLMAIILLPFQTSFEEYFFRGYLMQGLGVFCKNRWVPFIFTSVCFGLMHAVNPEVEKIGPLILVYYIGTGFFLGIITLMDEGLELALGFHLGNNLITALLVTTDWTVFQTHSIFKDLSEPAIGLLAILPVFIIYPILIFIMAKKYKWTNWKEKLFGKVLTPIPETPELNA